MKAIGYSRFKEGSSGISVLILDQEDFDFDELDLPNEASGYRFDICLIPISKKDTFKQSALIGYLMGAFTVGTEIRTQFFFYGDNERIPLEDFLKS